MSESVNSVLESEKSERDTPSPLPPSGERVASLDVTDQGPDTPFLSQNKLDRSLKALRLIGALAADRIALTLAGSEIRASAELSMKRRREIREFAAEIAGYLVSPAPPEPTEASSRAGPEAEGAEAA